MRDPERERVAALMKRHPWRMTMDTSSAALACASAYFKQERLAAEDAAKNTGATVAAATTESE